MELEERSNKRTGIWTKALVHFSFCFAMGTFAGLAPLVTTAPSVPNLRASFHPLARPLCNAPRMAGSMAPLRRLPTPPVATAPSISNISASLYPLASPPSNAPQTADSLAPPPPPPPPPVAAAPAISNISASFHPLTPPSVNAQQTKDSMTLPPRLPDRQLTDLGLLLIVTITQNNDRSQEASMMKLAHTLRLVKPPLIWIVVGAKNKTATTIDVPRASRVMFRHLTYAENFTDPDAEADHQRNVALNHIEHHRLAGVVHFTGASSIYDLQFFEDLRKIRGIAVWPMATVLADQRVILEGPTCNSSGITGWYSKNLSSGATQIATDTGASNNSSNIGPPNINISGFGFKSSMLWDSSERFILRNSSSGAIQDFIMLVHQAVIEDEDKLKGIPSNCSRIMLWNLHMPKFTPQIGE